MTLTHHRTSLLIVVTVAFAALSGCVQPTERSGGRLVGDDECIPAEDGTCRGPSDVCAEGDARCPEPLPPMIACAHDADCTDGFHCRFEDGVAPACGDERGTPGAVPEGDRRADDAPGDGSDRGDGSGADRAGDAARWGLCVRVPDACIEIYDPVCGCDGVTYDNECFATAAGAAILHRGACAPSGGECGGALDFDCDGRSYCSYGGDAECGRGGVSGICQARPEVCTDEHAPVCGCDGVTYGNACEANMAGASVDHEGDCAPTGGGECGGVLDFDCDGRSYCSYGADADCGRGGITGTCEARPEVCTDEHAPVCGCDGVTYGNSCEAHAAGVSVDHDGACGACTADVDCGDGMVCIECWGANACVPRGAVC